MRTLSRRAALPIAFALLLACGPDADEVVFTLQADRFDDSEWSEPVNLGPVVNSSANDQNASLSPDAHTLYFVSNRAGGLGSNDIWAAKRQCLTCPWEAPYNLGPPVNSAVSEGAPSVSDDGSMLFFFTTRADGLGSNDIYVSYRTGAPGADEWSTPVNLGPFVNSADPEQASVYVREGSEANASLYFNRGAAGATNRDIYRALVAKNGMPLAPAAPVSEINDPTAEDQKVTVRTDALELLVSSQRTGGFGGLDLWVSTRRTPRDPWSTPLNVGAPINTSGTDSQGNLSRDGRSMIFTSNRPGGSGGNDLWMTTRTPSGK